jgi:hypothetical protein
MVISFDRQMASLFHGFVATFKNIGFAGEFAAVMVDAQIVSGIDDVDAVVVVFLGRDNGPPVDPVGIDKGRNTAKTGHETSF